MFSNILVEKGAKHRKTESGVKNALITIVINIL